MSSIEDTLGKAVAIGYILFLTFIFTSGCTL